MKFNMFARWFLKNIDLAYESDVVTGMIKVTVCFKDIPFLVKEFKV